jgi:putative transposase
MKKRFTEEQIIGVLRERESGMPMKNLTRKYGVTEQTFLQMEG